MAGSLETNSQTTYSTAEIPLQEVLTSTGNLPAISKLSQESSEEVCGLPNENIESFALQIPGNEGYALEHCLKTPEAIQNPGDIENFPQPVQAAINAIQSTNDISQKASIAHNFAQTWVQNQAQGSGDEHVPFDKLVFDPKGDCDDYAVMMEGLLIHGGVAPENVLSVGGLMRYEHANEVMEEGHAYIIVVDEDKHYLLDNNLVGIHEIDPEDPIVSAAFANDSGDVLGSGLIKATI